MIFSLFFTRFGRERPVEKPRRAVFSLVFVLEITGETAVFAKDLQKVPILRGRRAVGKEKVGKRVFFAGFPFGLFPVVCTRVRQPRSAGCAASRTMKGSWAKSRHVSRNSCALFLRSRAVLSPQTQQPHPRRQGEGGVGEMWPPRRCSGVGRAGRSGTTRREGRAKRRNGNGTCHRCGAGAPRKRGMSEKVCKILLRPSPPAWGTPSRRGICDVDFSLSFYLIFHSRKYGSRLAYVPSVFSLATEPKR